MKILVVEPNKAPYGTDIPPTLKNMQVLVGGLIQAVYPFDEPITLVCNDEGKLLGLPLNRALYALETGELYYIIAGTFFLCAAPPDSEHFKSLTDEQIARYTMRFQAIETFAEYKAKGGQES